MSNSERFICAFNAIEKLLRKKLNNKVRKGFSDLVDIVSESNGIVKRNKDELKKYAMLRNAIIHEKISPDFVIAEPHETVVHSIEQIRKDIENPERVIPKFNHEVIIFDVKNSVADLLKVVRERSFSQFPIYDKDYFKGVLSENGITNWLARNIEDDLFSLIETKLNELLSFQEAKKNYKFINRSMTVYEAKELFQKLTFEDSPKPDALLITQNGKPTERLLGIITSWDIINI